MDNRYTINSGFIFQVLWQDFKKYDRVFLIDTVKKAYEKLLFPETIFTVEYNGCNGVYLENYALNRYPNALEFAIKMDQFPFPFYFLKPQKNVDYLAIVEYATPQELNNGDEDFDLFFALKFSQIDLMDADSFLQYHLDSTFQSDLQIFKKFIDNLCIKYNEFLYEKYMPISQHFFLQRPIYIESTKESNKEFTTARQVLAIHYIMEYMGVYQNTDKTEIARFIQFLNGKETGVSKINNTTIYKKLKSPFSRDNKTLEADLQFIRIYFEKLGIQSIFDKINKEIGSNDKN